LVGMLQQKQLCDDDYVWTTHFDTWKKVDTVSELSSANIRQFYHQFKFNKDLVFQQRQHPRVKYGQPVYLYNQKKLWKTETVEISVGGCGVVLLENDLQIRNSVIIHFVKSKDPYLPAFHLLAEVVRKKMIKKETYQIGLKFLTLNKNIQSSLKCFTESFAG